MEDSVDDVTTLDRANALEELGRHEEAIATYQKLLGGNADSMIWGFISFNYLRLERFVEALHAAEMSLSLDPSESLIQNYLAWSHLGLRNIQAAEQTFLDSLTLDPDNPDTFHGLASICIHRHDFRSAQKYIHRGLRIDPRHEGLQKSKLIILAHKNDLETLDENLDTLLSENPTEADLLAWKALVYCESADFNKAEEIAIQSLSIDPENEKAKLALLTSLKHRNFFLRFFVGKAFGKYKLKITLGTVILIIIFAKGVALWGGFFIIYMLITWVGGVAYNTLARLSTKMKLILNRNDIRQSNFFLINLLVTGLLLFFSLQLKEIVFMKLTLISVFIMLAGISFFEVRLKTKRTAFLISLSIMFLIIILSFKLDIIVLAVFITLLTILHGVLFTFRAISD